MSRRFQTEPGGQLRRMIGALRPHPKKCSPSAALTGPAQELSHGHGIANTDSPLQFISATTKEGVQVLNGSRLILNPACGFLHGPF